MLKSDIYFLQDHANISLSFFFPGSNSPIMIAVICSLLGIVLIGVIVLFLYHKKKKSQEAQRSAQLQLGSPVSAASHSHHAQLPRESPPPYSSVVANAPPPYSATMPSHTANT